MAKVNGFEIDKGVPLPMWASQCFPVAELQVGESFFVPTEDGSHTEVLGKLRSTAHGFGYRKQRKYVVRKVEGGVRCWRTA